MDPIPLEPAILESPYAGDIRTNKFFAETVARKLLFGGFNCFASHLYYPHFLNEHSFEERKLGIEAGLQWAEMGGIHHVFFALPTHIHRPSPGMIAAHERHKGNGRLMHFNIHDWDGAIRFRLTEEAFFHKDGWPAGLKEWGMARSKVENA